MQTKLVTHGETEMETIAVSIGSDPKRILISIYSIMYNPIPTTSTLLTEYFLQNIIKIISATQQKTKKEEGKWG